MRCFANFPRPASRSLLFPGVQRWRQWRRAAAEETQAAEEALRQYNWREGEGPDRHRRDSQRQDRARTKEPGHKGSGKQGRSDAQVWPERSFVQEKTEQVPPGGHPFGGNSLGGEKRVLPPPFVENLQGEDVEEVL